MLKRFIRYLYEYEKGKRTRNVGFVKTEQEDTHGTIHIHGKGLRLSGGDALLVSLFFEEDGILWSVPQGEIAYMGSSVNYQLRYTDEDAGAPEHFEEIKGILLENGSGRRFAAVWDDVPINVNNIRPWRQRQEFSGVPDSESASEDASEALRDTAPDVIPEEMNGAGQGGEEAGEITEIAQPAAERDTETMPDKAQDSEMESQEEEQAGENRAGEGRPCRWKAAKIQRGEISRLPRCEWRLANNNFLLHGYNNYRHLVLLDDGKILKLGVPGIYHEQEARAAAGFGFPEFINIEDTRISLDDEECNREEQFGYWCRQVRRPVR